VGEVARFSACSIEAMNPGPHAHTPGEPDEARPADEQLHRGPRLELPHAATELLAIVRDITAEDGPLQPAPEPGELSPWHEPTLLRALERLEEIDHYLRGRVAFLVAGTGHGYGQFEGELELAGLALDTCRATARVVDALLARRLPTKREYEAMIATIERLYPALKAFEDAD
jgi:hypothetical protein